MPKLGELQHLVECSSTIVRSPGWIEILSDSCHGSFRAALPPTKKLLQFVFVLTPHYVGALVAKETFQTNEYIYISQLRVLLCQKRYLAY